MESFKAEKEEKRQAVLSLLNYDVRALERYDGRLTAYLSDIQRNPDAHNVYEVLAASRFFGFLDKYEYRETEVRRFVALYESLKFSGTNGRQCYKLTPVQYFQFANIFGFYKDDDTRLTREVILFVPRKYSKTTSVAAIAVNELLFGDANAQAYTGANSYTQAQICFKEIRSLIRQIDPKKKYLKTSREHIEWKAGNKLKKESTVDCLTGGAETKDGLNASVAIMDEYAQAKYVKGHSDGANLLNVLRSSMGLRKQPLTIIITTASRVQDSPFTLELENAKAVLRGDFDDDSLFASIFCPDAWELEDIGNPAVWRKCQPHMGVTVREDFYEKEYNAALRDPEKMAEFKSKLLNIFTSDSVRPWVPRAAMQKATTDYHPLEHGGRMPTMVAFDLSVHDDFSAVTYNSYSPKLGKMYVYTDFYIPEETLNDHPNKMLYKHWADRGYLKVCKGAVIDNDMIVSDILSMAQRLNVIGIGYDAYKSREVVNKLYASIGRKAGKKRAEKMLTPVPQTFGNFTSPVEAFEVALFSRPQRIEFHNNPIQTYCFTNAYLEEDRLGNKKPVKKKANLKIDAAVTTLMTFYLFQQMK